MARHMTDNYATTFPMHIGTYLPTQLYTTTYTNTTTATAAGTTVYYDDIKFNHYTGIPFFTMGDTYSKPMRNKFTHLGGKERYG